MFDPKTETVLTNGLQMMTKACDALTKQNEILNEDIHGLKRKIDLLQERLLTNYEDKE